MAQQLTHKGGLGRDGFTITPTLLTIHQRMGKGDIVIPVRDITQVSIGKGSPLTGLVPGMNRNSTLEIRVGSKKYSVRRLTNEEAKAAQAALGEAMSRTATAN